jgi:hypothetical protein
MASLRIVLAVFFALSSAYSASRFWLASDCGLGITDLPALQYPHTLLFASYGKPSHLALLITLYEGQVAVMECTQVSPGCPSGGLEEAPIPLPSPGRRFAILASRPARLYVSFTPLATALAAPAPSMWLQPPEASFQVPGLLLGC